MVTLASYSSIHMDRYCCLAVRYLANASPLENKSLLNCF